MHLSKRRAVNAGDSLKKRGSGLRRKSVDNQSEWQLTSQSPADTDRLGRLIGQSLQGGEVLGLSGQLGSGKTALVRGIAAGLRAAVRSVTSPTFVLIHEYDGRLPLAHVDLYRIGSEAELSHIGLSDYFSSRTVTAIEWAAKAGTELPRDRLDVSLVHRSKQTRELRLQARGPQSQQLLDRAKRRWERGRQRMKRSG
ncbi:MAG: tRNA (adenosine(37)-N6)-threonylcarbamoyltransferase complex ATPase subunit type 1 TsaE [Nitrospiraceae bacterium]